MKEKIGKGLLSFFVVMFFCTLIARGASSMTVAKVTTDTIKRGNLTQQFQGTGKIVAGEKTFASLPEGQKVARILVNTGTEIKKGQPVVQLDLTYLQKRIDEKTREVERARITLRQQELEGTPGARVPATEQAKQTLQEAAAQAEAAQKSGVQEEITAAKAAYQQAEQAYELAKKEEEALQSNERKQKAVSDLAMKSTQLELDGLQEALAGLEQIQAEKGMVSAPTDGRLESVGAVEGTITTGTEQIVMETGAMEACGILPPEQIGVVKNGDEVQIRVEGEAKSLTVTIERFGNDEDGNSQWYGKVEGNYRAGTTFSYEYRKTSEQIFEKLIPLTALHEAQGTAYVLIAEIRSGILGDVYTAVKVPVTVLEKDEEYAAVQTTLSEEVLIITQSSKYVEEGDRVR